MSNLNTLDNLYYDLVSYPFYVDIKRELEPSLDEFTLKYISWHLTKNDGEICRAAKSCNTPRKTLWSHLKRLEVDKTDIKYPERYGKAISHQKARLKIENMYFQKYLIYPSFSKLNEKVPDYKEPNLASLVQMRLLDAQREFKVGYIMHHYKKLQSTEEVAILGGVKVGRIRTLLHRAGIILRIP